MSIWKPALAIARKDLTIEWRNRTALLTATVFAILVLLIFIFARDPGVIGLPVLAPAVLWVALAFASLVALNRAFLLEREHSALDGILSSPAPRAALFWGKWLANLCFVLVVQSVAFPLWILFFNVQPSGALVLVAGVAVLTAIGFTAVGTVLAAMAVRTRFAELLLPVLLLPFMLPPVFFAAQLTTRLLAGRPADELWGWIRLLSVYDVVFLAVATLLFPVVVEE
ncbi:MAG: heme exporter protein CcmB [Gemmatimonadales bacterium]